MDRLIAQRLADVLELSVNVGVQFQRLLIVVGVRLEQRDLAVLRGKLLLAVQLVARDWRVFAARCTRSHRSSRRIKPPSAAKQIAEQTQTDTGGADDASGQRGICLAIACILHILFSFA